MACHPSSELLPCLPVTFKLRPEERVLLRTVAAEVGVGPSTFAADVVRRALGTVRRRAAPQVLPAVAEAVREATGALGRVGNLVNQVAKRTHRDDRIPHVQELAAIRTELAAIDQRLSQVLAR